VRQAWVPALIESRSGRGGDTGQQEADRHEAVTDVEGQDEAITERPITERAITGPSAQPLEVQGAGYQQECAADDPHRIGNPGEGGSIRMEWGTQP
jgi:hypothetical protein